MKLRFWSSNYVLDITFLSSIAYFSLVLKVFKSTSELSFHSLYIKAFSNISTNRRKNEIKKKKKKNEIKNRK